MRGAGTEVVAIGSAYSYGTKGYERPIGRETVNRIRYLLEAWLPPVVRDSRLMRFPFRRYWGSFVDELEEFRVNITRLSNDDYRKVYECMPRIQNATNNSQARIDAITERALPGRICDVGCGTGTSIRSSVRTYLNTFSISVRPLPSSKNLRASADRNSAAQREYRFTFSPQIRFSPYPHSFLRHILPVPAGHQCYVIGRDLLYVEYR